METARAADSGARELVRMEDQRLPDPALMIANLLVGHLADAEAIFRQMLRGFAALGEQMATAEVLGASQPSWL